ncbi:caspase family protein [Aldersonia sp. NBC_00410]|uniref:caspase family protein n=1 Tax=Aldersonia sp. NBC_00410 TaxID=2975954 RepID=UPI0022589A30|nr:caspase family protein [Aldersonia sp. NBC_00410]MCX5042450.1 caspase family protein [Aldersonia sp. NBC_00410]
MYRALLICNSVYPADPARFPALNGPTSDGLGLWRQLTDADTGLFKIDDVDVLFENGQSEILETIDRIYSRASNDDTVLLYFSGHGLIANEKLYLCGRDSIGHSIRATGISTELISDIIHASKAGVSVIILDCCHSGGFKGNTIDDVALRELSGEGRYVITATTLTERALDASERGAPSPFTAALIQSLASGADDANSDGFVDIDDLMRDLQDRVPPNAPRPERDFDGSGIVRIARRISHTSEDRADIATRITQAPDAQPTTIFKEGFSAGLALSPRSRGDITRADVRRWVPVALASMLAFSTGAYTLSTISTYVGNRDDEKLVALCAVLVGGALLSLSLIEAAYFWYHKITYLPRREIIETLRASPPRVLRPVQYAVFIGALAIVLSPVSGRGYVMWEWIVCLSCLGATLLLFAFRWLNRGDEAISTAGALTIIGNVVPVETATANGHWEYPSGMQSYDGIIYIAIGLALSTAWYFRSPKVVVAGMLALLFLCLLANAGTAIYEVHSYWFSTACALAIGTAGAVLGSGEYIPLHGKLARQRHSV